MKRSYILLATSLLMTAAAAASVIQCGPGGDTTDAGDSGGGDVKPPKDSAGDVADGGSEASVTPKGTELAPSDQIQIFGITDDDDVIYADGSNGNSVYAVPSAGGTAVKIGSPSNFAVGLHRKTVFVWSGLTAKGVGILSIWEHGGTLTQVETHSAPNGGFAASADGKHIIYTANADVNGANGDIFGANSDASGKTSLVTGVDIGSGNNCTPRPGFVTNTLAITSTCTVTPPDGGTPSATVTDFVLAAGGDAGTTWTPNTIISSALNEWSTDTAGDKVLVATTTGLSVCTLPVAVCTAGELTNIENNLWTFEYMNQAGSQIYYEKATGDLRTATTTLPAVATDVQATNVNFVRAVSADDKYILYTKTFDTQQFGGDLFLTPIPNAGAAAPVGLVTTQTGALFGVSAADDFTADSTYVVFIQNLNTQEGLGDLMAVPVTGGTPKQYATGEWQNVTATGTKIVYNDNCSGCSGTGGTGNAYADIHVVDVATSTKSDLQVGADVPLVAGGNSLYLSHDKTKVIYAYSQNAQSSGVPPTGGNGLYSIAIP
jgi:hypothetical protein